MTQTVNLHHQLEELCKKCESSRKMLEWRHAAQCFGADTLFDRFARVVCGTGRIPRKELLETWAVALLIHNHFPDCSRVADLACSHGLLSWALLLLAEEIDRSAVCVDIRMPPSAERVADAMGSEWPALKKRWDYVEGPLEAVQASSSTLLCGVHACGFLSDVIIGFAIKANAPVVLVPCCHVKWALTRKERDDLDASNLRLSDYVDNIRVRRLREAGFDVQEELIPEQITPKNRIILAIPPIMKKQESHQHPFVQSWRNKRVITFSIPLADTELAREHIQSLAGRAAADARKLRPATAINVSFFSPDDSFSPEHVASVARTLDPLATVEFNDKQPFFHIPSGRYARTYRVTYHGTNTKKQARAFHVQLCHLVPLHHPGADLRGHMPLLPVAANGGGE